MVFYYRSEKIEYPLDIYPDSGVGYEYPIRNASRIEIEGRIYVRDRLGEVFVKKRTFNKI